MKHIYTLSLSLILGLALSAQTDHLIVTQGLAYSPDELTVQVGDNVTINASGIHPTTEVSEETWNANMSTPLSGGFGTNSSSFTFEVTEPGIIYYVCDNHVASGMKGRITVNPLSIDELINEVSIDFGRMPIEDGVLRYSIKANENDLGSLKVISVSGQQVIDHILESPEGQLELRTASGIYVVLLMDRSGDVVFRESITLK